MGGIFEMAKEKALKNQGSKFREDILIPSEGIRDAKIDLIKGLFIFLVVLGHLIRGETSSSVNPYGMIHFFIYTIHMPAFIFISGILSKKISNIKALLRQLIIPYVMINIPILLIKIVTQRFEPLDLITPWEITWYLLTLFGCRILIKISESKQWIIIALTLIISVASSLIPKNLWLICSLGRTMLLYPLFYVGKNIKLETMKSIPKWIGYCLIAFCVFIQLFIPAITKNVTITWATHDYPNSVIEVFEKYIFFIAAVSMVIGLYVVLSTGIYMFERWGRNSMVIYLFHIFVCYLIQHFLSPFEVIYLPVVLLLAFGITEVLSMNVLQEGYAFVIRKMASIFRLE